MKELLFLAAVLTFCSASVFPTEYEVNPKIDTSKLVSRLSSILIPETPRPDKDNISTRNAINDQIIALLESLREGMETGWPESGIPPLDPFTLEEVGFDVAESFILKVHIVLRDLLATGLKDFIISKIDFKILRMTLDYEFIVPQFDLSSDFDVSGKVLSIIPVNPKGEAKIGLTNLTTWGNLRLSVNRTGYLRLVDFNIDYDADNFRVYLEGLFEIDKINELLNMVLLYLSNDFFQGQRERLTAWLNEVLFETIANAVSEIKWSDIIG